MKNKRRMSPLTTCTQHRVQGLAGQISQGKEIKSISIGKEVTPSLCADGLLSM